MISLPLKYVIFVLCSFSYIDSHIIFTVILTMHFCNTLNVTENNDKCNENNFKKEVLSSPSMRFPSCNS